MEFYVEKSVLDSGLKILFATVTDLKNERNDEWLAYRAEKVRELYEKYKDADLQSDEILEGFHVLHDKTGVKRRKNIPASENLIRHLVKRGDMPFINTVVDIYNLISIKTKLALGAHDMDKTDGNVTLRFTDGTERFLPIGQTDPVPINAHEYCYCDDNHEVLCRLEIRQVLKTAVDDNAKNVFYIVQGNAATPDELLSETAQIIIDTTTRFCGGKGSIIIPKTVI